ncbi:MAG: C25 family cysteine peptidase, partial [Thermoanaerobaculia bacterium]
GFDPGPVAAKIGLWCGGIEQPLVVDTGKDGRFDLADFVEFYGLGLDTASTAARAYWLRANGSEARYSARPFQSLKAPVFSASVPFTVQRTDRWFFVSYITGNPEWDGWAGVAIGFGGTEDRDFTPTVVELNVENLDRGSPQNATLSLDLQGITYGRHIVDAWVGGRPVGTVVLNNQEKKTVAFSFSTAWLPDGNVRLNLRSRNGWEDYSGLQSARLTYPHLLRAQDGLFQAALPPQSSITVDGFAPGAIRAIDVTDPLAPEWLDVKTTPDGAGLKASFVTPPGAGDRTVLVVGENRFLGAPEMAPNRPSSWTAQASTLSADMVIVTHGAFAEAARTLEAFRDARGIATTVVDVEDIYDEVSFGIRSADAIRNFLQSTSSWAQRPRFAILLGDASSDPRNYFDLGLADFVPTKMLTTEYEKTAADDWFSDFDDDDIADIPIGRIPARTAAEAATMISKITSRATTGTWLDRAVFVADANIGWNFERSVDLAAAYLPATTSAQKIRRGRGEIGALIPALDAGAFLVEYIGHGTVGHWTGSFGQSQALAMTNGDRLPVVITMTCLNGYFHDIYQDSLAEAFLKAPNGGASAVWASSSLTYPHTQEMMNNELMRRLFAPGSTLTIGEAMALAKRAMNDRDVRRSWILFGDPSMSVR